MNIKKPHYFDKFSCVANKCTDSCCIGWDIEIDEDTLEKYKSSKSNLSKKFNKYCKTGTIKFVDGVCPFLNNKKLCDIQLNLGENMLCKVCNNFPRFVDTYGSHKECILSLSCPEVARLILEDENVGEFVSHNIDESVDTYNEFDTKLYLNFLPVRDKMFYIIQKDISLHQKLNILYNESLDLALNISKGKYDFSDISNKYLKLDSVDTPSMSVRMYLKLIEKVLKIYIKLDYMDNRLYGVIESAYNFFKGLNKILKKYNNREIVKNELNILKKMYSFKVKDNTLDRVKDIVLDETFDCYYLRVFSYFIYKHILSSVYDYEVVGKMAFSCLSTMVIKFIMIYYSILDFSVDKSLFVEIVHLYSKEIEHNEKNMKTLYKKIAKSKLLNENFKNIIAKVSD